MITRENPTFTRHYKPGQTIVHPADAADWLLQLESGLIRVAKISANGKISTLRLVRPGDYFGEEHLTEDTHENDAMALSETTVRSVNPNEMMVGEQRAVSVNLAQQLGRSMEQSCHIRNRDLRHRVAWYLLELLHSAVGGVDEARGVFVRVSHQLIAEGIGASRESVSDTILTLAGEGILRGGHRQLMHIDAQALEQIVRSTSDTDGLGHSAVSASEVNPRARGNEAKKTSRYPNFISSGLISSGLISSGLISSGFVSSGFVSSGTAGDAQHRSRKIGVAPTGNALVTPSGEHDRVRENPETKGVPP